MNKTIDFIKHIVVALSFCATTCAAADQSDDMTQYAAVISQMLASDTQDNESASQATDASSDDSAPTTGQLHERHLGLGFAHGVSNTDGADKAATTSGAANGSLIDACHGDGHAGTYNDGSNDNGIGRIDCGNPSPSD